MHKIILLAGLFLVCQIALSQNFDNSLQEARTHYGSGDMEGARFALQQAMNELDQAIGQEILKLLPRQMGNLPVLEEDQVVGSVATALVGLHISRSWGSNEQQKVSMQLMADSPLLTGINAILSLPMFGSDPNQKRVRIAGYRGLLQRSEGSNGVPDWDLQVPIGSSLLSMNFSSVSEERTVMDMANTLPLEQIARMLQ